MNIGVNYQVNFSGLVPKALYCGKPKLPAYEIEYVKKLETLAKQNEKEIMETENQIDNPVNAGRVKRYLKARLSILNEYRHKISASIHYFKQNRDVLWSMSELKKGKSQEVEELEKSFEKASNIR